MTSSQFVQAVTKDADFDEGVLNAPVPVLVVFRASWNGPCKQLAPVVEKIAEDFRTEVRVVSVDIDDCPETSRRYGVRSVPMAVAFEQGRKTGSHTGLTNRETLLRLMGLG
ncbi:thioredoxin family protein [Streptomyces sp. RK9]|uniref:thioredoxin family protein n=1 Tax=Streptomyces sp. RK9 TaxID=3239284 RepID=UPI00386B6CF7